MRGGACGVVWWRSEQGRGGKEEGGGYVPVTRLQARAEAQTLTALAWHEAFQLASAVEPSCPAQPWQTLSGLPACHITTINSPTHARNMGTDWSGDQPTLPSASISLFFLTTFCSGSFPRSI